MKADEAIFGEAIAICRSTWSELKKIMLNNGISVKQSPIATSSRHCSDLLRAQIQLKCTRHVQEACMKWQFHTEAILTFQMTQDLTQLESETIQTSCKTFTNSFMIEVKQPCPATNVFHWTFSPRITLAKHSGTLVEMSFFSFGDLPVC